MARGDYADITYRTGAGTEKQRIQARTAGSEVVVGMPGRGELFIVVAEYNAATPPVAIRSARFAASEVVAIVEGNEAVTVEKTKK